MCSSDLSGFSAVYENSAPHKTIKFTPEQPADNPYTKDADVSISVVVSCIVIFIASLTLAVFMRVRRKGLVHE